MNPQGFSFPPPPPPPPTQQYQPQQQLSHSSAYTPYGQNQHGRGGRGAAAGNFRGRGRGYGGRGAGRGGHFTSDSNRPGGYTATAGGYAPMTYLGYPTQQLPNQQNGFPAAHYTQAPSQNSPSTQSANSFASTSQYSHSPVHAAPYQHQSGYGTAYTTSSTQQSTAYSQPSQTQHGTPTVQPPMMGPPMRWGFGSAAHSGSFSGPQRPHQRGLGQNNSYNDPTPGKNANKRDHTSAFRKPQSSAPRVPAPPPVPSFGNPLPLKPPVPAESPRKPKKKKRKHNQLGLTPKTEEHESSEEEDDADEEARLAKGGTGAGIALQVTYRGRTSKLQTSDEIAAWIAERKKRFPTQAKVAEKKKAMEEANKAKKAKQEAQRQQKEAQKVATQRAKKEQEKRNRKEHASSSGPADAAAKAKSKAEKLRQKLMKEEKRIAQAEADAKRVCTPGEAHEGSLEFSIAPEVGMQGTNGIDNYASTIDHVVDSVSESDDSDWTSSSGSDLSSSDSDESDDDAPPEESTSRREGPERVAPPAREEKRRVCRHFARNGRCPRGKTCKFVHEKPECGNKTNPADKGRKGLLEAVSFIKSPALSFFSLPATNWAFLAPGPPEGR